MNADILLSRESPSDFTTNHGRGEEGLGFSQDAPLNVKYVRCGE